MPKMCPIPLLAASRQVPLSGTRLCPLIHLLLHYQTNCIMRPNEVKYIVLHCSATRSNTTYTAWQLDQDHRQRGFRCAGYHFYVRRSGEIVGLRPTSEMGAHVSGYNRCSIGVCYEGGLAPDGTPADTRTDEQRRALRHLLYILMSDYPQAVILGHRDLTVKDPTKPAHTQWLKACPCFDARQEYAYLNDRRGYDDATH